MIGKNVLGILAVVLTCVGYGPYFYSIFRHQTRPHMFSWLIWGTVNGIAFAGQYSRGGGAGSWTTGFTALLCLAIFALAVKWGERNITRSDWAAFIAAIAAILLWLVTNNPLGAMILVTLIDVLGCYPTLRKSYAKPYEENVFTWGVVGLRSFISLFALEHYSLVTVIFPLIITGTNSGITCMLLWRRAVLGRKPA